MLGVLILSALVAGMSKGVSGQAISSIHYGKGPGVIIQDPATGDFLYNLFAEHGYSDWSPMRVNNTAKNGTALASVAYTSTSIYGSVFYQAIDNHLIQLQIKCAYSSGNCVNYGERNISGNVSVPIHPETQLSASLPGQNIGYRVTYEDINGAVRQLAYSNSNKNVSTNWDEGIQAGNFSTSDGLALANDYTPSKRNQTQTEKLFQISEGKIQPLSSVLETGANFSSPGYNKTWTSSPPIDNLPAWNPANVSIGAVIYGDWYCLFYIDMTRQLQFVRSTDLGQTWSLQPRAKMSSWPLADAPNAPIAASRSTKSSDRSAYLYYRSGGNMTQVTMTNYTWRPALVVGPNITTATDGKAQRKDSKDIVIAISISAAAVLMVVVSVVAWCFYRMHKKIAEERSLYHKSPTSTRNSSIDDFKGKPELHGEPDITELDHDPECLLLHQLQNFRRYELKGAIPVELDGSLCKCELHSTPRFEMPSFPEKVYQKIPLSPPRRALREDALREDWTGSRKGKNKVTGEELPDWSWEILRREKEELRCRENSGEDGSDTSKELHDTP